MLSQQMLMVAVAWQMYDITASAWDLGLVGLFQFVPALLLTLPAGHLVDKLRRGRIFAFCILAQGIVALLLVFATENSFVSRELILGLSSYSAPAVHFRCRPSRHWFPCWSPLPCWSAPLRSPRPECRPPSSAVRHLRGDLCRRAAKVYGTCTALMLLAFALMQGVHDQYQPSKEKTTLSSIWLVSPLSGIASCCLAPHRSIFLLYCWVALRPYCYLCPRYFAYRTARPGPAACSPGCRCSDHVGTHAALPIRRKVGPWLMSSVAIFGLATVVFGLSEHFGLSLIALAITGAFDNISVVMRQTLVQLEHQMRFVAGCLRSTRFSLAPRISSANSNLARQQPCSARLVLW